MSETITRLFDSFADAERAVIALEDAGVPKGDISLVTHGANAAHKDAPAAVREPRTFSTGEAPASDAAIGAVATGAAGAAGGALAGLGLIAVPGLGPVVAAGWLASLAVGAVAGVAAGAVGGGLLGALTNAGVSEEEAHVYAEAVRRGATLVSAKIPDDKRAAANAALANAPYVDIARRRTEYVAAGWVAYDPNAAPYTPDEVARERATYVAGDGARPLT